MSCLGGGGLFPLSMTASEKARASQPLWEIDLSLSEHSSAQRPSAVEGGYPSTVRLLAQSKDQQWEALNGVSADRIRVKLPIFQ